MILRHNKYKKEIMKEVRKEIAHAMAIVVTETLLANSKGPVTAPLMEEMAKQANVSEGKEHDSTMAQLGNALGLGIKAGSKGIAKRVIDEATIEGEL